MPDAFQKKSDFEEEELFADSPLIPSLTEDIVYCPKCGSINSFKKSKSGRLHNHFRGPVLVNWSPIRRRNGQCRPHPLADRKIVRQSRSSCTYFTMFFKRFLAK